MMEALKRNITVVKANNSAYGNFIFNEEKYFFKIVTIDNLLDEVNGYLEVNGKLNTKKLIKIFNWDDTYYYLIYEYDKTISKDRGLINDVFTDYEYNNKTFDKNIFVNIINLYRSNYRNLKLLDYSKNSIFFEQRIKTRLIDWYKDNKDFDKEVNINLEKSTTTRNIISETIDYFNHLDKKLCVLSGGDPNTFNLSVDGTFYDLSTAGYNNIYGELAITFISYLIHDAYLSPKYNKNSYINHDLIFKYRSKFKPKISFSNDDKINIKSNIVTSSIRKKFIRDYLNMLIDERVPITDNIKYYLVMRILCVFNINKFNKQEYYYSLYLLHYIYNFIQEDALESLVELLDQMDEI